MADRLSDKLWWVDPYRDHLVAVGLSAKTVQVYEGKVRQALRWCEAQDLRLDDLSAVQLREMASTFPQTHTTLRQLRAGLGHYFEMVGRDAPLKAIRVPKKPNYRNRALVETTRLYTRTTDEQLTKVVLAIDYE